jgi:tripartite-type tricarboxylate transporter receptor subunit TctC
MSHPRRRLVAALCIAPWAAIAPRTLHAQGYPSRPIRFVVPSPPGGGTDTLTRLVASKLTELMSWQLVVDNRPGAGGNLGMDLAAKSPADGYTLVMGESSNTAINPSLYARLPFDPAKDLAPVVLVGTVPLVLVVSAARGWDSTAALVAAAKAKSLTFASSGNGTVGHLVGEMWKRSAGVDVLHVPYKGAGPVMTDLIGGQVDLHFASIPAAAQLIKSGKLRALAVTSAQRTALLPDVPTLGEAGYKDFDYRVFYGVLVPAGTPADVIAILSGAIDRALQAPDVRAAFVDNGVELRGGTPEQFAAFLGTERAKWARVVKTSGAKVD